MRRAWAVHGSVIAAFIVTVAMPCAYAQQASVRQPDGEPGLSELLNRRWGLHVDRDLRNPIRQGLSTACVFRPADHGKPVTYRPLISLGSEELTSSGWYPTPPRCDQLPADMDDARRKLAWRFAYRAPRAKSYFGGPVPQLLSGETTFNPGPGTFSLWVANASSPESVVHLHPALNRHVARFKDDPCRARIYPNRHARTGELIPDSFLIAWDYSGDGFFQDLIAQIDNVKLLPAEPPFPGILATTARVRMLADGFKSTNGLAWSHLNPAVYFTDPSQSRILRFANESVTISTTYSHGARGLIFDKQGRLLACEVQGRRISRATPSGITTTVVSHYQGKPLSGPQDLCIDQHQGVYFTNATEGPSELSPEEEQAVYYVTPGGMNEAKLVAGALAKPAGITLSPDGRMLYVVETGKQQITRFRVLAAGLLSPAEMAAYVSEPEGMAVDEEGRLYVAGRDGIWVLDHHGNWIGIIETLEKPHNCTFGGARRNVLFITAGTSLYGIETRTLGWQIHLDGVTQHQRFNWDLTASSR